MSEVKMVILSTDNLDGSIRFYTETLGMSPKVPPTNAARVYDNKGNGIVFYKPLGR